MRHLSQIHIEHVRNLKSVACGLGAAFNVFYGVNGSGKTSILEAIHILGTGRSFRSVLAKDWISFGAASATLVGVLRGDTEAVGESHLKISRTAQGKALFQRDGHRIPGAAALAEVLPLHVLNAETYLGFLKEAQMRRRFLDAGLFHVEPLFGSTWSRYHRVLRQRNQLLHQARQQHTPLAWADIEPWNDQLILYGAQLHQLRTTYLHRYLSCFSQWVPSEGVQISYHAGWPAEHALADALMQAWTQDRALGHTTVGPHRGDLLIHQNHHLAHKVLSRGQWKLFICALLLARAQLLRIETQKTPIFLIDDLEAELDVDARKQLCAHLHALSAQAIITGISESAIREAIGPCAGVEDKWFHVEHGCC